MDYKDDQSETSADDGIMSIAADNSSFARSSRNTYIGQFLLYRKRTSIGDLEDLLPIHPTHMSIKSDSITEEAYHVQKCKCITF